MKHINILGYVVGNMTIKPDSERMRPLQDFPVPCNKNALHCVLGMFVYYVTWIDNLAQKCVPRRKPKCLLWLEVH